jgi:hypothetical protein
MRRREFITLFGGAAAAWPLTVQAQQPDTQRRIGVLMVLGKDDPEAKARITAFRQGLQDAGWVEGRNMRTETRWSPGNEKDVRRYAEEIVALAPDVILANGNAAVAPLLNATRSVPIVSRLFRTQSALVSLKVWHGQAVMQLGLSRSSTGRVRSGWSCLRRSRRKLRARQFCGIRPWRRVPVSLAPSSSFRRH